MKDWKEQIKASYEAHADKRVNITTALNSLLFELKQAYGLDTNIGLSQEYPLQWDIKIGGKKAILSEAEIDHAQHPIKDFEGRGQRISLNDALKELLVEKFK